MIEVWVDLCDEEGNHGELYQISSEGRIYSQPRYVPTKGGSLAQRGGRMLSRCRHHNGYLVVGLAINGRNKQRLVNRLVAFSFYGPPPEPGMEACHGDGDRLNNRVTNIRWDTKLGNAADKKLHGTDNRGSTNPRATITEHQVDMILVYWRAGAELGITQAQIAEMVDVHPVTVNHILTGRTWSHHTGIEH